MFLSRLALSIFMTHNASQTPRPSTPNLLSAITQTRSRYSIRVFVQSRFHISSVMTIPSKGYCRFRPGSQFQNG